MARRGRRYHQTSIILGSQAQATTTITLGVASQVNVSAFSIGRLKTYLLGTVPISLSAFAITFFQAFRPLGIATVTVTAYALSELKTYLLGTASVVTTAYAISRLKVYLLGAATQVVTTAYVISRLKTYLLGTASVTTTAYAMSRLKTYPLGTASVSVTAYPILFHTTGSIQIVTATVTVTAYPITMTKRALIWDLTKWFVSRAAPTNKWSEKQR